LASAFADDLGGRSQLQIDSGAADRVGRGGVPRPRLPLAVVLVQRVGVGDGHHQSEGFFGAHVQRIVVLAGDHVPGRVVVALSIGSMPAIALVIKAVASAWREVPLEDRRTRL